MTQGGNGDKRTYIDPETNKFVTIAEWERFNTFGEHVEKSQGMKRLQLEALVKTTAEQTSPERERQTAAIDCHTWPAKIRRIWEYLAR